MLKLTRVLALGTALAALAGGAAAPTATAQTTGAAPPSADAFVAAPINWKKCKDDFLADAKAQCGMLAVPLNHADPTGPTIRLAVSRVRHRGPKDRGVMFTNPGGPGGSGTFMAGFGQFVPGKVGRTYDWIGMDPRGVGDSKPALTCDRKYFKIGARPPYEPRTQATIDAWLARAAQYAEACRTSEAAELLPFLRTTDTVADFEVLREALGVDEVSFYGYSYGTYIAQVYATLHPDRLDKIVMDGVVNPTRVWYQANLDQDVAFEKVIKRFFRWVARGSKDFHLGTTAAKVEKRYYRLLRELERNPIKGFGSSELADVVLGAGYANFLWPSVAEAIAAIVHRGDTRLARQSFKEANPTEPGGDNGYAMYVATICSEAPWPTDWAVWQADNTRVARNHPFVTWANAWFNAPCLFWPVAPSTPVEITTSSLPALLISETLDAATPFSGALEVRRRFPASALIEGVGGTTHASSLSGVGCVDKRVAQYLATGKLPKRRAGDRSDVRCDALPEPPPGLPEDGRLLPRRPPVYR